MKKELVAGLVIASMISGVSSVYADYTDQDIDAKVNELKQADDAIRGQIGDINGKYNRLEQAQGDLKTKLDNLSAGTQDINGRVDKIEEKQKADDKRIGDLEAEDGEIKKEIGKISDDLNAEKTARGEQEKTLSTNIEGVRNALGLEITNRETKDKELDEKIAAEAQERDKLDKRLSDRLDQEHADLEKEINERKEEDTKIRGEFAEADKKLDEKITAEAKAREDADKELEKKLTGRDNALAGRIDKLATDTDKGLAKVSALAGLHPLDYDPANKLNLAAAGGSYNGEHAFALGAFYRPNRNVMLSFGASLAGGDNAYNVGVSVKVGKGGDRIDESNTTVSELYYLVGQLQDQIAEQQRKIEELEAR